MERPSGTVTLLFTDIAGSSRAWEAQPEAMANALVRHDELLRTAIERAGGFVFKTVGDAFCAAFSRPVDGLKAALAAQRAMAVEGWPEPVVLEVRMALHTGVCEERDGDYFGPTVNRVARLEAVAHGGQIVLSRAAAELVRDLLPDEVVLMDLGEHRLKDLGRPERVFQVDAVGLETTFPPLRSLDNPELGNNLPAQLTSFIGRKRELREIRVLIDESRLVTLVGAGGVGKTRLALQIAAELVDLAGRNGVWFADLAPLSDPELVAPTVASAIGVHEEPGHPVVETLVDTLQDRNVLIVLDNCEHMIVSSAQVAVSLLRSCPLIHIIVTSREPLNVSGERVYRVPSLTLPLADHLGASEATSSEAVRLFIERAADHRPDISLDDTDAPMVASVCRRLDGIPLAIELAAARLRSMTLVEIDGRLDDRFRLLTAGGRTALPRHQTLRALIDWSYELLSETDQAVLARLWLFGGGWNLEAAEAVCGGDEGETREVLDRLSSLVDKSLVQTETVDGSTRYDLLETIRQYAGDKLAAMGEDAVREATAAHVNVFLDLAEEAAPHLLGASAQSHWVGRLEREHANLRAAMARLMADTARPERAVRLAVALRDFWILSGNFSEGIETLDAVLALETEDFVHLRGQALVAAGYLRSEQNDYASATAHLERGLAIARSVDDPSLISEVLFELSWIRFHQGDFTDALALADEALDAARLSNHVTLIARALRTRANALAPLDRVAARTQYIEALDHSRATGDLIEEATSLQSLALLELGEGDLASAQPNIEGALRCLDATRDDRGLPFALQTLGLLHFLQGDRGRARRSFVESLVIAERTGARLGIAYALIGLAGCAAADGDDQRAAMLHGAVDALLLRLGESLYPDLDALKGPEVDRLRRKMGDAAFADAYEAGGRLSIQSSTALAVKEPGAL
jgi:predicted ATPase/class 3 adenylate cyclase